METLKKFFIFEEAELSYILGNENPKKLLIFQEATFQARKTKRTDSSKVSSSGFKKLLIFKEKLSKPQKPKFIILLQKNLRISFSKNTLG